MKSSLVWILGLSLIAVHIMLTRQNGQGKNLWDLFTQPGVPGGSSNNTSKPSSATMADAATQGPTALGAFFGNIVRQDLFTPPTPDKVANATNPKRQQFK